MYLQVRGKTADTVDKELLLTVFFQYFGIAYEKENLEKRIPRAVEITERITDTLRTIFAI